MGTFGPSFDLPTETLATPKAFPLKIPYRATCRDPIFPILPYVAKIQGNWPKTVILGLFGLLRVSKLRKRCTHVACTTLPKFSDTEKAEKSKNERFWPVSLYFCYIGQYMEYRVPAADPIWDFEGEDLRGGKGFGWGIERRSKCAHLTPQTSPKRILPGRLLIPYF